MILLLLYPGYVNGGKAFYLNHILIWTLKKREKTQIDQLYQFVSYSLILIGHTLSHFDLIGLLIVQKNVGRRSEKLFNLVTE